MPAVEQDLTQGSVTRKLVRYALPLVASSLLQAIYSITDIIIAGHYIGDVGISAINNASIIMNMLTQLAIGLTVGGNVLVGQYFWAAATTRTVGSQRATCSPWASSPAWLFVWAFCCWDVRC